MNEPIGSVQPVVLLEEPVEIVSARGQEIPVLDRIDAIDAGECVVLMGPSGSGNRLDEHYRLSGSAHVGRLSVLAGREVGATG